ncbi:hypothetical protein V5799_012918 [Amblyomma americanum]|uniref:Uncharacterized protein n=1 Tax=Amblyomma americanum TaxID=6943 RepID=A0AAQ4E7C3_AMBAM
MSEVENVAEGGVPAAARKKSLKQQEKAKQHNQSTSKKQRSTRMCSNSIFRILCKRMLQFLATVQLAERPARSASTKFSTTVVNRKMSLSSHELKNAVKERELDFLKRRVELQLSSFQQTLDHVAKRQQDWCADALPVVAHSIVVNGRV